MDRQTLTIGAGTRGNAVLVGDTLASDFNNMHDFIEVEVVGVDCQATIIEQRSKLLRFQNLMRLHVDLTLAVVASSPDLPARKLMLLLPEKARSRDTTHNYSVAPLLSDVGNFCELALPPASVVVEVMCPFGFKSMSSTRIVGDLFCEPHYTRLEASLIV